jgi:hypothetical protein
MFFAFLSMTLFPAGVILYFLEKGHSHMAPDRTVGHCRRSFRGSNHWIPDHLVAKMNSVDNIFAEHLDYTAEIPCMFEGWNELFQIAKFIPIPYLKEAHGYTRSHCFEFKNGSLTISFTHQTESTHTHHYVKDSMTLQYTEEAAKMAGQAVLSLLFRDGKTWEDATMKDVRIKSKSR